MHVRMHVFLGDSQKLFTFYQRGFHRKIQDQARRPVPGSAAVLVLGCALADGIRICEEVSPSALRRSDERAAMFDELR
jgi:hypothetical protein